MNLFILPRLLGALFIYSFFFLPPTDAFGQDCDCEAFIEVYVHSTGGCCTKPVFGDNCATPIDFEMTWEGIIVDDQDSYCWSDDVGASGVGTWTLSVTDANGCTSFDTVVVTEECTDDCDNCTVTFQQQGDCCLFSVAEGCNGQVDFEWNLNGQPFQTPFGNDHACDEFLLPGTYTVTVTDEDGCTATDEIEWCDCGEVLCAPLIAQSGDCTLIVCAFGECELPGEFIITVPNNVPLTLPSNQFGCAGLDVSGFGSGEYCVEFNSGNGCPSKQACITMDDCDDCTCNITTLTVSDCHIRACVSDFMTDCAGPLTFQWETPAGLNPPGTISNPVSFVTCSGIDAAEEGLYCVTLTDANGCISSACIEIEDCSCEDLPDLEVEIIGFHCFAGDEHLIATNPNGGFWDYCDQSCYSVAWSDGVTTCSNGCVCGALRTVVVTDLKTGCTGTDSYLPVRCDDIKFKLSDEDDKNTLTPRSSATMDIYPNPTHGIVNVEIASPSGQNGELAIIDITGRVLQTVQIDGLSERGTKTLKVDLSNYAGNLFYLNYNDGSEPILMKVSKF